MDDILNGRLVQRPARGGRSDPVNRGGVEDGIVAPLGSDIQFQARGYIIE